METVQSELSGLGFRINNAASTKLVLDFPYNYGISTLKSLNNNHLQLIVVTSNPCQEYMEDLWDLGPSALLAGEILHKQNLGEMLSEVVDHVSNGRRYRLTPGPSTSLTRRERDILHYVARGWSNKRIAQQLYIEEQSVKNTLRYVYKKLTIRNHGQAILYYWGMSQ
jgi:DNA-binding NarL/FixJ family response regulator